MKPKKKTMNINFDEDVAKFLKKLSNKSQASWFVNEVVKNSNEFKTWKEKT